MTIRAVLFDYGGTLDGPASHWLDRFVDLYREAGLDLPFERIKTAFYDADAATYDSPRMAEAGLREMMEFHVAHQCTTLAIDSDDLRAFLINRFVARSETALAASRDVLVQLRGRFRLGVVSNFYGNVARILTDARIAPLLSVIVDSHRVGVSKPDPRIYARAVEVLGTEAGQTMHVGDSYERDVLAARAAGLRTAWLVGNSPPRAEPSPCVADIRLEGLDGLLPYLAAA